VTARGRALLVALLVLATSACGGSGYDDDHDRLLTTWERDDQGFPPSDFGMSEGESHCDMDSVLFLGMRWPLDGGSIEDAGHVFVRDPEGVLARETVGSFVPDAELPDDAVPTGYENYHGVEVWLANDLSTAYAVDSDTVEAWPALPGGWICA
jgi:hypothetical protein